MEFEKFRKSEAVKTATEVVDYMQKYGLLPTSNMQEMMQEASVVHDKVSSFLETGHVLDTFYLIDEYTQRTGRGMEEFYFLGDDSQKDISNLLSEITAFDKAFLKDGTGLIHNAFLAPRENGTMVQMDVNPTLFVEQEGCIYGDLAMLDNDMYRAEFIYHVKGDYGNFDSDEVLANIKEGFSDFTEPTRQYIFYMVEALSQKYSLENELAKLVKFPEKEYVLKVKPMYDVKEQYRSKSLEEIKKTALNCISKYENHCDFDMEFNDSGIFNASPQMFLSYIESVKDVNKTVEEKRMKAEEQAPALYKSLRKRLFRFSDAQKKEEQKKQSAKENKEQENTRSSENRDSVKKDGR